MYVYIAVLPKCVCIYSCSTQMSSLCMFHTYMWYYMYFNICNSRLVHYMGTCMYIVVCVSLVLRLLCVMCVFPIPVGSHSVLTI